MEDKIDIYTPPGEKNRLHPVVFYIHGGAWHTGERSHAKNPCENLSKNGYVCVAPSYALTRPRRDHIDLMFMTLVSLMSVLAIVSKSIIQMTFVLLVMFLTLFLFFTTVSCFSFDDHVTHPKHIQDVAEGFKWVVDNISRYKGDPNQIFLCGHSAGGHLATLLSTNSHYLNALGVDSSYVKGCIGISGVYSDHRLKQIPGGTQILENAFGKRSVYYDAFPIYNITSKTPPTLLINAALDTGLKRQTWDYHYALRNYGVFVETAYFENSTHANIINHWNPGGRNEKVFLKINQFIQEVLDSRSG
jgi:acetyl esterase/lipase